MNTAATTAAEKMPDTGETRFSPKVENRQSIHVDCLADGFGTMNTAAMVFKLSEKEEEKSINRSEAGGN